MLFSEKSLSSFRFRDLNCKYKKLKNRIERSIRNGTFFRYTKRKQNSLFCLLQRYYQRLMRWGKVASGTALVGGGLLVNEPLQGQMFTKILSTESPFIIYPSTYTTGQFGLIDVGADSAPAFVDIDGDGDIDAFVGEGLGNINFFENTGNSLNPAFTLVSTESPFGLVDVGNYSTPTFADIDGDGDLDALVGEEEGNINFFENTGNSLNPAFTLVSTESPFGLTDVGNYSTPTLVDIDEDGDLDVFIGEADGNTNFFENTSTDSSIPAFSLVNMYNAFGLIDISEYSVINFADIDGDGDLDAFVGEELGNINFFENIGTSNSTPVFDLISRDSAFGLSDIGSRAFPTFADIDGDGDLDALVGESAGIINFFENTGNPTNAFFQFLSIDVGTNSAPSFADIDGDGDLDAFVGETDGNINFLENIGTNSSVPVFSLTSTDNAFGLTDIGTYSTPTLVDIDGDGDFDLFVGEGLGNINFFENLGNSLNPAFSLVSTDNAFGLSEVNSLSTPTFVDIDGDGDLDAFVGERDGNFNFFENIGGSSNPAFSLVSTDNAFGLVDLGFRPAVTFADIDNDGDYDAFLGKDFGGLAFFENIGNSLNPTFFLSTSSAPFGLFAVGGRAKPVIIDLDKDGFYEAIFGEGFGMLNYFESDFLVPVELTTFSAKAQNGHVFLHWQTASETDNKGFHIERSSTGKNWESIGFVNGHGTTVEVNDYSFRDKQPLSGINYYRLRQIDFDGSQHYSDIVQVHLKKASLQISPNPVSDVLQVQNGEGRAIVYDLLGRVVKIALITNVQTTLPVQDLPQGQYVLSVTRADGTVVSERFVK